MNLPSLTLLTSPLVIGYWATRYVVGLSTPFDNVQVDRPSLLKVLLLGLTNRLGTAGFPGAKYYAPDSADVLMKRNKSAYPNYAKSQDGIGYWLAKPDDFNPECDPCLVYAHGGGYYLRLMRNQLKFIKFLYESLSTKKLQKLAVLIVDYPTMIEGKIFPSQFEHAKKTWSFLQDNGFKNVMLLGDSAGGHMCLNILQWLDEKRDTGDILWPTKALLVSPWMDICPPEITSSLSMENAEYDYLTTEGIFIQGQAYASKVQNPVHNKFLNIQINSAQTFWKMPCQLYFIAGANELLLRPIQRFIEKTGFPLAIEDGGVHDGITAYEITLAKDRNDWETMFGAKKCIKFLLE